MLEQAIERRDLVGENLLLKQKLEGQFRVRQHHRQEQEDAELLRAGRERGRQRREHPDPGRERHRQGADRQRASTTTASAPRARSSRSTARRFPKDLIESELFGYKKGAFTGAHDRQGRPVRDGGGRLAAARRDRRDAAVPADQAAARAAGARVPADRQRPHRPRRLPADLRDQHRSRRGAARRQAARGSLLPHQHDHAARAAAARADRRHPAAVRALPREVPPALSAEREDDRAGGVSPADPQPLAGQRPRARERDRARRAGRQGQRRSPSTDLPESLREREHDRRPSS